MDNLEKKKLLKDLKKRYPEPFLSMFPVRYSMPSYSCNPEYLVMASFVHAVGEGILQKTSNDHWLYMSAMFVEHGSRVYAPTPEVVEDLMNTEVKGTGCELLYWPVDCFAISMPRGVFLCRDDGYLENLIVGRWSEGNEEGYTRFGLVATLSGGSNFDGFHDLKDFSLKGLENAHVDQNHLLPFGIPEDPHAREKLSSITAMAIKLISFMTAEPEDIEEATLDKKMSTGNGHLAPSLRERDYWKPWIIGKDHASKRAVITPGSSRKLSVGTIRSGHWRNQMIGPRDNPDHKLMWIKPHWVGPKKEG